VLLWEAATALCGALLGIHPFDQPDVAAAKAATNQVLADGLPDEPTVPLADLLDQVRPGDYLGIQAFVDPGSPVVGRLDAVRMALRDQLEVATTLGLGPRFLHSTGQLHKGGPPTGVLVQVVGEAPADGVPIPGKPYDFATLERAQAAGDLITLRQRGRRAGRVALDELLEVAR
jgi:transaldolase/glucose-6-phosphate isomerase